MQYYKLNENFFLPLTFLFTLQLQFWILTKPKLWLQCKNVNDRKPVFR